MNVKRSGVRSDFQMIVPVQIDFGGDRAGIMFMQIRQNEETLTQELKSVPRKIIFAPDHSLLANIRRE